MGGPDFCHTVVHLLCSGDKFYGLLVCITCFVVLCSIPWCRAQGYVVLSRLCRVLSTSAAMGGVEANDCREEDDMPVMCTAEEVQAAWTDFYADLSNEELHNLECFSPR